MLTVWRVVWVAPNAFGISFCRGGRGHKTVGSISRSLRTPHTISGSVSSYRAGIGYACSRSRSRGR